MWQAFRAVPTEGMEVPAFGRSLIVRPSVFWPHRDSEALIETLDVKPGAHVLDVGTGCGIIALAAALKGATRVLAIDKSPIAVDCAAANAARLGLANVIETRRSDVFAEVQSTERFDLIAANLPFTDGPASDLVEATMLDPQLAAWKDLFSGARNHLRPGGRLHFAQANFGNVEEVLALSRSHGFRISHMAYDHPPGDLRVYFAFEVGL